MVLFAIKKSFTFDYLLHCTCVFVLYIHKVQERVTNSQNKDFVSLQSMASLNSSTDSRRSNSFEGLGAWFWSVLSHYWSSIPSQSMKSRFFRKESHMIAAFPPTCIYYSFTMPIYIYEKESNVRWNMCTWKLTYTNDAHIL